MQLCTQLPGIGWGDECVLLGAGEGEAVDFAAWISNDTPLLFWLSKGDPIAGTGLAAKVAELTGADSSDSSFVARLTPDAPLAEIDSLVGTGADRVDAGWLTVERVVT